MAIYGVVMNQAVSMASLGANVLTTGYKRDEFLYSCSAVILVNPLNDSAGLYHFPAGDVYRDVGSRVVIRDVIADVRPTQTYVVYGTLTDYMREGAAEPDNALLQYLRGQLGFAPTAMPAVGGSAAVQIVAGVTQVSRGPGATFVTDLDGFASGTYAAGYTVYWKGPGPAVPAVGRHRSDSSPAALSRRGH